MSTAPKTTELLTRAIELAARAHAGQVDRAGDPYILHPLRVMGMVESLEAKTVAALHDVVEDTYVTFDDLRALLFPEDTIEGVDAVTRRPTETYGEFIARAAAHPVGRQVKLADVRDHLRSTSKVGLPPHLSERYHRAIAILEA